MSWPKKSLRGFTLIEIMVSISILAILTTTGLVFYGQALRVSRDAVRKQDLRNIQAAIELFYQRNNNNYPDPLTNNWVNSRGAAPWITGLDANFIPTMPVDPTNNCDSNTAADPLTTWSGCFYYAYYHGDWNNLNSTNPGYILMTRLENSSDPEAGQAVQAGAFNKAQWPPISTDVSTYSSNFILANP